MLPSARTTDRPLRVVIADDECLFRTSLRQLLTAPPAVIDSVYGTDVGAGFDLVGEAASGEETIRVVQAVGPDLLLLDVCMPRMSGIDVLRELSAADAAPRTILLSGSLTEQGVLTGIRLGVRGMVVKAASAELLFEAIASVMAGRYWLDRSVISNLVEATRPLLDSCDAGDSSDVRLTPREREVLALVVGGLANKEIARKFAVSENTVKHHLTHLYTKFRACNRDELAALASRRELDPPA